MFNFFKNFKSKNLKNEQNNELLTKTASLLIHAAKIDQEFTNNERKIIKKAINNIIKKKIKVSGPISADSSFTIANKFKYNVIVGMYHDQVLGPYKALYNYNAINITLGLPYIRISPDHGVAENIVGKKIANPQSLIESIKFFNNIN